MKKFLLFIILVVGVIWIIVDANTRPKATSENLSTRVYLQACDYVRSNLKAPATAKFSGLIMDRKDCGAQLEGNNVWHAWGWVDSQNSFSALLRNEWDVMLTVDGNATKVLFLRLGDQRIGSLDEAKRAAGQPTSQDRARERAGQQHASQIEALRDTRHRSPLHDAAQKYVERELRGRTNIRHSTLLETDDQFTICKWIGGPVWEARGVVDSTMSVAGAKPVRNEWRALLENQHDGTSRLLYLRLGDKDTGDEEHARQLAGLTH